MTKELMNKKSHKFYKQWKDKKIDYSLYRSELEKALNSTDSLNKIRMTNIPTFTFPLPNVDVKKIRDEAQELISDLNSDWMYTSVIGYPDYKNWKIYWLYKSKKTNNRDGEKYNFSEADFEFVYKDKYFEIKKLIENYCWLGNPIWLSVLEPNGLISLHADKSDAPFYLSKMRLPIYFPKESMMLLEGVGKLDYYSDELVLFNHRIPHAVYNFSNKNKIDISVSIKYTEENKHELDLAVKQKIEKILEEM